MSLATSIKVDELLNGVVFTSDKEKIYNEFKELSVSAVLAVDNNSGGLEFSKNGLELLQKMEAVSDDEASSEDKIEAAIATAGFLHGVAEVVSTLSTTNSAALNKAISKLPVAGATVSGASLANNLVKVYDSATIPGQSIKTSDITGTLGDAAALISGVLFLMGASPVIVSGLAVVSLGLGITSLVQSNTEIIESDDGSEVLPEEVGEPEEVDPEEDNEPDDEEVPFDEGFTGGPEEKPQSGGSDNAQPEGGTSGEGRLSIVGDSDGTIPSEISEDGTTLSDSNGDGYDDVATKPYQGGSLTAIDTDYDGNIDEVIITDTDGNETLYHQVQSGDTLSEIAEDRGIPLDDLLDHGKNMNDFWTAISFKKP